MASHVNALERVGAAVCLEAAAVPTRGVERRVVGRFWELDQGKAWVVEEHSGVTSEVIAWLLDFS